MTRYAQRMLIENGISEAIQFFHLDALSSMVGPKIDFDLQITLMASSLYRLLGGPDRPGVREGPGQDDLQQVAGGLPTVQVGEDEVIVSLDKRAHNPYLVASGLTDQAVPMPWLGNRRLSIQFS